MEIGRCPEIPRSSVNTIIAAAVPDDDLDEDESESFWGKPSSEKNDIFFSIVIGHSVLNSSTFWKASKDSSLAEIVR